jgi:tRNA-Thr(GGU) m(6)t(6)A37 methyltransferase TsaA
MELKAIGHIQSCFKDKFGTPRQPGLVPLSKAILKIDSCWQPELSLQGLQDFQFVWLIWGFHKNTSTRYHPKVHPPRYHGKTMGVFATRSPHRPNPLGLSVVQLLSVDLQQGIVHFGGIDLVDGTPIYDIKPYLPAVEALPRARVGWVSQASQSQFLFQWAQQALISLQDWADFRQQDAEELRDLIQQTLQLDPRPLVYRGYEGEQNAPYRSQHAVRLWEADIHFSMSSAETIQIMQIKWGEEEPASSSGKD